jgi:hypothetical protein
MDFGAAPGTVEITYVLFMDLVGYSLQTIDRQGELLTRLQEFVQQSREYQAAERQRADRAPDRGRHGAGLHARCPLTDQMRT